MSPTPARARSLSALVRAPGSRLQLRPKRDALTRVRHDLRSMVHSVAGYGDLLLDPRHGPLTDEQLRFVGHVRAAAEHIEELVDACIELSRPNQRAEPRSAEQPTTLEHILRRVRSKLAERHISCDLTVAHELGHKSWAVDIGALERALTVLALVITREAAVTASLSLARSGTELVLVLRASDAVEAPAGLSVLDGLEDRVSNRDFVRLKLSEALLSRQGSTLRIASTLDAAEIELPV